MHEGNKEQIQPLRDLVKALSEESGNKITYYPSPVEKNSAADERDGQVGTLCGAELDEIDLMKEAFRFQPGHGVVCGAHHLYGTGIDDQGRLYYQKSCFGFRNAPEKIVLALYDRLQKENKRKAEEKQEKT